MNESKRGQVTRSPAEVYDEFFVPGVVQHWRNVVADAAGIGPSQRVLDLACGTGVLAFAAPERIKPGGMVVGLDVSEEMLGVPRRKSGTIEWRDGRAELLPLPDESFDAVVTQSGFMFCEDPRAALREMIRVLRPGGRLAVAACDALDHSQGYTALGELLQRAEREDPEECAKILAMPCAHFRSKFGKLPMSDTLEVVLSGAMNDVQAK